MPNLVEIGRIVHQKIKIFSIFKMVAAAVLDFKFLTVGRLKRVELRRVSNLVEIGQTAAEI